MTLFFQAYTQRQTDRQTDGHIHTYAHTHTRTHTHTITHKTAQETSYLIQVLHACHYDYSCCTHKGMVVDPPNSPTPPNQHVYVHSTCTSNMNDAVALMTRLAGISLNTSSTSAQGTTLNRCRGQYNEDSV